jgi:hypothetical protein
MTDHEKLLVALLSESEEANAVGTGGATTLDVMAALYGIGPTPRLAGPDDRGGEGALRLEGGVGGPAPPSSFGVDGGAIGGAAKI